jgi:SOS response regulatory protein OraA/RecX
VRLDLVHSVVELNQAVRLKGRPLSEPIRITTNGTLIAGFGDWHQAVSEGRALVDCIEYPLSDQEALECILVDHQPRRTWNSFNRVRVALELKPYFQKKALANQITGGKYKGSANLPKAEHIDVREEIASLAGVGSRTVSNVKMILEKAAPGLKEALHTGALTINRALHWCALPQWKQMEQFADALAQSEVRAMGHNVGAVLEALQQKDAREPGSVEVQVGTRKQTVILLGQDLLSGPTPITELANR